jgi:hypothetical protein
VFARLGRVDLLGGGGAVRSAEARVAERYKLNLKSKFGNQDITISASRVETRRFKAMGELNATRTSPTVVYFAVGRENDHEFIAAVHENGRRQSVSGVGSD